MQKTKEILRVNDLRPTKQRVLIGNFLFDGIDKHVTAESLFKKLSKLEIVMFFEVLIVLSPPIK